MEYDVYAGCYTGRDGGEGIYHLRLDTEKKTLKKVNVFRGKEPSTEGNVKNDFWKKQKEGEKASKENAPCFSNPSFLVVTDTNVYAVSEEEEGKGGITAWQRDAESGSLKYLNHLRVSGTDMCHLCLWPDGKHLSAANYTSGSLAVCSILEDGSLGEVCDTKQHTGVGFDKEDRQKGPHVHSTTVSADGQYLYVADLGLDQIFCYKIEEKGRLKLAEEERQIHMPAGSGPRHFCFTQNGKYLYVATEMGNKLCIYEKQEDGVYQALQQESMLDKDFQKHSQGADIHISDSGRFLYVSNRGENTIAVFEVSPEDGRVKAVGRADCGGDWPRNFCLTPEDDFLLIANQYSGDITLLEVNKQTGLPGKCLVQVKIPAASFVTVL